MLIPAILWSSKPHIRALKCCIYLAVKAPILPRADICNSNVKKPLELSLGSFAISWSSLITGGHDCCSFGFIATRKLRYLRFYAVLVGEE